MDTVKRKPYIVWMRTEWKLKANPFPSEAIARLGGDDNRENGLLFEPDVQQDKVQESMDKFVLGAAYDGLKFGYLWSLGTGLSGDARGFGKSSLMQYMVQEINHDFGQRVFVDAGLDETDADETPVCAVLASFDMGPTRSLSAIFFEAARYAARFKADEGQQTLVEKIRDRLIDKIGSDKETDLLSAVESVQTSLRGRTLGPPVAEFLKLLCSGNSSELAAHIDGVTPTRRTRNGANYLATLLLFIRAAGIGRVILCCDQLEDFASTTTTRQKRTLETERFRDYILELQPMSDMLTCIVTMHPRATQAIGDMWHLADLPSYDHDRAENQHRVVILERLQSAEKAGVLIKQYLGAARNAPLQDGNEYYPFDSDAIHVLFTRADGKPREILRKAHSLITEGAANNWSIINGELAAGVLDTYADEDDDYANPSGVSTSGYSDVNWSPS